MIKGSLGNVSFVTIDVVEERLPGMEATSNVRMVDKRDQLVVRSTFKVSIALSQVHVNLYRVFDSRHREDRGSVLEVVGGLRLPV
jgi:hypothetical protein